MNFILNIVMSAPLNELKKFAVNYILDVPKKISMAEKIRTQDNKIHRGSK
jgi:hypothetical protein